MTPNTSSMTLPAAPVQDCTYAPAFRETSFRKSSFRKASMQRANSSPERTQKALPDVEEWLGMDNVREEKGELIATATVPAGEVLLSRLLSFGDGIKILEPASLANELCERAKKLYALYE